MQFQPTSQFGGSWLQGRVITTYERMVQVFGRPHYSSPDDPRIRAHWAVIFEDGTRATIYDWKTGTDPWNNVHWNIGGFSERAVERVQEAVAGA